MPALPLFLSRKASTWSTPMAGRSELPSGKPSSLRLTELRLGEPEPPAKKRIIDVAVLVEPSQLARVARYRVCVRCSLPTAGVFSESASGRVGRPSRAAFPVAGAKADAGWNGFLPLGRARSAAETRATHSAQLAASFDRCRDAHAAIPPGLCAIFTLAFAAFAARVYSASLTRDRFQGSVIGLRAVKKSASVEKKLTKPAEPVLSAELISKLRDVRQPKEGW